MGHRRVARSGLSLLLVLAGGALALSGGLTGCTAWATYPTLEGSFGTGNPALTPIPELMSMAIRHTHEREGGTDPAAIVFNLPAKTPTGVYERVIRLLGGGRPMEVAGEPAIHVVEVRVRTTESEVDVIHLGPDGDPQEMTIAFRQNIFRGFRVVSVRPWAYRVVMPDPHYPGEWQGEPQTWPVPDDQYADGAAEDAPDSFEPAQPEYTEYVPPEGAWNDAEQAAGVDAADDPR